MCLGSTLLGVFFWVLLGVGSGESGYAAKVTPQVTQSSLHSQGYLCDGYAAKVILLRLHIQGCIAEVTQPRIRGQGYAPGYTANLAQPMLRSQGYAPGYTSMLA